MNFFSGIDYWHAGHFTNYSGTNKMCGTSYGIQYNHCGKVRLRIAGGKEYREKGSYVFITQPGINYEYGACDGEARDPYFICFRGKIVQNYIESGLLPIKRTFPLIKIVHSNKFRQSMLNLEKAIHSHTTNNDRMELMLLDLLLQLHEQSDSYKKFPASQLDNFS